ncbi:hypothetical protein GCM10023187_13360 [Nibrella viscosa]|uniref:Uncharacterized protein n=1 Tax=Nibrella viscosa TaxID=1084524 RepID=A0ABP8K4U7_9BACT
MKVFPFCCRFLVFIWACSLSLSCARKPRPADLLNTLPAGQAKVLITLDGQAFYPDESSFSGAIQVFDNYFRLSLFDQYEGNVVIALGGEKWYSPHPVKRQIFVENQLAASVLIGKLIDKEKRLGEGYLMTDGEVSVDALSEDRLVLHFSGKAGKYNVQREPEKWNQVEGTIVYKKPAITVQNVEKAAVYF